MADGLKEYLKEHLQWKSLWLDHPKESDFILSPWQRTHSLVPLLLVRLLLFLCSLGILFLTICTYIEEKQVQFWCIFLTHWALVALILAVAFSIFVPVMFYLFRPPIVILVESSDPEHCLPWYVKVYWVLYNIATPVAFLVTVVYWTVLYRGSGQDLALEENHIAVNISVHVLNSVVMMVLLVTSSQPYRLGHAWHALLFGAIFVAFSSVYQSTGGLDPQGRSYIYPWLDWADPYVAYGMAAAAGVSLALLQGFAAALAAGRDAAAAALDFRRTPDDEDDYDD